MFDTRMFNSRKLNTGNKPLLPKLLGACLFTLIFFTQGLQAATLRASVDRNHISSNEILTLQLTYDESAKTDQLDLSQLQGDFDVLSLNPSTNSSISFFNGQKSSQVATTWTMTLAPRRLGTLTIPAFTIDGTSSAPIQIRVSGAGQLPPKDQPLIIKLIVEPEQAYVGQQVLINVELRAQDNLSNINGGRLTLPGGQLELINEQNYNEIDNGIAWQVVRWTYALFPDQAGTVRIPPQLFSGILQERGRRPMLDPFGNRGRRIAMRSESRDINVIEPPSSSQPWFPANSVKIRSRWSGNLDQARVGEPLTRTIEIIAEGQLAAVIPPLKDMQSTAFKSYKDQPQLENKKTASHILGIRTESEAIVPTTVGLLELPEQTVQWWNLGTGAWETVVLPAETLNVLPAVSSANNYAPSQETHAVSSGPNANSPFAGDGHTGSLTGPTRESRLWRWATMALAVIVLLQFWIIWRRPGTPRTEPKPTLSTQEPQAWKQLQSVLKQQNPAKTRDGLLNWSRAAWPAQSAHTLDLLSAKARTSRFQINMNNLSNHIYGDKTAAIDWSDLQKQLLDLRAEISSPVKKPSSLPPLYPQNS